MKKSASWTNEMYDKVFYWINHLNKSIINYAIINIWKLFLYIQSTRHEARFWNYAIWDVCVNKLRHKYRVSCRFNIKDTFNLFQHHHMPLSTNLYLFLSKCRQTENIYVWNSWIIECSSSIKVLSNLHVYMYIITTGVEKREFVSFL